MRRLFPLVLSSALLTLACSNEGGRLVAPTLPTPVPAPAPAAFAFAEPYTPLAIGQVVTRHVGDDNPMCVDLPGWHCHYFRITAPSDGKLDVMLTWVLETQPFQPLDMSLRDSRGGEAWSDYGPGSQSRLRAEVKAGSMHQITVWYTFPGVEFALRSSFEPN